MNRATRGALAALAVAAASGCGGGGGSDGGGGGAPEAGKTVKLAAAGGVVTVTKSKGAEPARLDGSEVVPIGAVVDASKGRAEVTTAKPDGGTQSAKLSDGEFEVQQKAGSVKVTLALKGGDFGPCNTKEAKQDERTVGGPEVRRLFADGKGDFQTKGRFSAATVRGTKWLTIDACRGTLTRVTTGDVVVDDFNQDEDVPVSPGKQFWDAERPEDRTVESEPTPEKPD